MASGIHQAQIVGRGGSFPNNKEQQLVGSVGLGCLPFASPSNQHSDNYPDVIDNETYIQRPFSESSNDVSANTQSLQMPSSSSVEDQTRPYSGDSVSGYRVPGTYVQTVSDNLNEPNTPDQLPYSDEQSDVILGRPNPVPLPSYRQIQTRDINVGVSSGFDQRVDALPDLLHSHVPQPSRPVAVPSQHRAHVTRNNERRTRNSESRNQAQHRTRETNSRSRNGRRSRTRSTSSSQIDDPVCKAPCVRCFVTVTSFRWVLVVLSLLGVCCVVTGIVLAALQAAGNSFLFLAIMFLGLGVLLVIVVGVGWKCTPRGHEPLHALFGIGDFQRRRDRRPHRTHRSRDNNWYGGVLYPEFQYRRPPPTYAASMQDYQQQLFVAQQQQQQEQYLPASAANPISNPSYSLPSSPPPSYRSRASTIHSGIHITFPPNQEDFPDSRPPTYRSQRGSSHTRPPIPREEFESMDSRVPADVSFAGPENSAQRNSADVLHNSSNDRPDNVVSQSDSTVTVNGRVIEPATALPNDNNSRSQTATGSQAEHTSSVQTAAVATNPTTASTNDKQSVSNNSSSTNSTEEPQRVETSL